jgi:hypothetical protein
MANSSKIAGHCNVGPESKIVAVAGDGIASRTNLCLPSIDDESILKRLTSPKPKARKEDLLVFQGEYNKMAPNPPNVGIRSFALDARSLFQLLELNQTMRKWFSWVKFRHSDNTDSQPQYFIFHPFFWQRQIVFELHVIHEMIILLSYEFGQPNPLGGALNSLALPHQDIDLMTSVSHLEYATLKAPHYAECGGSICGYGKRGPSIHQTFIGIDCTNGAFSIQLPSTRFWEKSGLGWLWNSADCCEAAQHNSTPWAGRVCDCEPSA